MISAEDKARCSDWRTAIDDLAKQVGGHVSYHQHEPETWGRWVWVAADIDCGGVRIHVSCTRDGAPWESATPLAWFARTLNDDIDKMEHDILSRRQLLRRLPVEASSSPSPSPKE